MLRSKHPYLERQPFYYSIYYKKLLFSTLRFSSNGIFQGLHVYICGLYVGLVISFRMQCYEGQSSHRAMLRFISAKRKSQIVLRCCTQSKHGVPHGHDHGGSRDGLPAISRPGMDHRSVDALHRRFVVLY